MIYLLLSFFITFSAHSRGHEGHHHKKQATPQVGQDASNVMVDNPAKKPSKVMLSPAKPAVWKTKSTPAKPAVNNQCDNVIARTLDHNRKTVNAILDKLNSCQACNANPRSTGNR